MRDVARTQEKIVTIFASDEARFGPEFMVWRTEQRAIGESMICYHDGSPLCMASRPSPCSEGRPFFSVG